MRGCNERAIPLSENAPADFGRSEVDVLKYFDGCVGNTLMDDGGKIAAVVVNCMLYQIRRVR